ncbi:MAG TPA: MASE1 domain-containing protein [Luteibacter sp.]|uniref:sensor histidine kinase n=1 Tax=Luteibacter sp. TaxID=1886636 RepID=UPI002BE00B68|nr:MASE1 domain-containing protein [Luteibacter sp.]HVI55364.1 MASE1 domain-containing protein [Luteibacter sp.]
MTQALPSTYDATRWCGGVFVGVMAAQLLSAALWSHQGGTHIVWFPGAVLLGALLATPRRLWPALMGAALVGLVITGVSFGLPLADTALVVSPAVLLTPVAAWAMQLVPAHAPPLEDFTRLYAFAAVAVIALPAACATLIDYASHYTSFRGSVLSDWPNIALAHALGYVLYVPVWVSVRNPDSAVRHQARLPTEFYLLMVVSTALLGVIWYGYGGRPELVPVLCLAPAPIIIAAIIRAQMTGSSIAVFIIVIMAGHLSVGGYGPFTASTAQETTLALQLWTLTAALSALTLGVVVEQRFASRRALDDAHEELREMTGRLIATQEQERARLARDLHDDINQRLAASSIGLSALRRRVPPSVQAEVAHIQHQVIALSEDVRQLSHELHPSCLDHAGLRDSLEALCHMPRRPRAPQVVFIADQAIDVLSADIALCFYRVTQEALTNALRHAEASQVTIKASVNGDLASLWIFDDGKGIDPDAFPTKKPGIGLLSMSERAKLLGGSFELRTAPGKGVDVCLRIPLETG